MMIKNTDGVKPGNFSDIKWLSQITDLLVYSNIDNIGLSLAIKDGGKWIDGGGTYTLDETKVFDAISYMVIGNRQEPSAGQRAKQTFSELFVVRKSSTSSGLITNIFKDNKLIEEVKLWYHHSGKKVEDCYTVTILKARITSFFILTFNREPYEIIAFSYEGDLVVSSSQTVPTTFTC